MRALLIGAALGVASGIAALALARSPLIDPIEAQSYDWRLQRTARADIARRDIVLVDINDSTLEAMAPLFGRWPWPRLAHAGAIDFMTRAGARLVAYDALFLEPDLRTGFPLGNATVTGAESDAAFAEAIRRNGRVILLADATYEGLESGKDRDSLIPAKLPGRAFQAGTGFIARPALRLPYGPLADAAAAIGHNFLPVDADRDGTVRRAWPFVETGPWRVPSLGMAAALMALSEPAPAVPLDADRRLPASQSVILNFHGGAKDAPYRTESFFDVLVSEDRAATGGAPVIPLDVFHDKIVFIGASAAALDDTFATPFAGKGRMPGIQFHAALTDDVLSKTFMRRASRRTEITLTIVVGLIAGIAALTLPVWWAIGAVGLAAIGLGAWLTSQVAHGVWIAAVTPMASIAIALFGGVAWQYFVEGRDKRRIKQLFGRYVSKSVFDQLQANPSLAGLGGKRREMSVLFSDIRGFTAASETSSPEAVVDQLNEYFTAMVQVLHMHQGTLDKFVGDMVMGLFGAPVADPRHADHAVEAARAMSETLEQLNIGWASEGRPTLDIGIGINSGEMIAGNIGADTIMSYTVIGDAVNLASRLESLNKEYGTRIIVSDATRAALTNDVLAKIQLRPLGEAHVKGRSQPVTIFEVK
jgi:adenylate cyclase